MPHSPRKRFGQHFLQEAWIAKIVDEISPRPGELFVEIGAGPGNLTLALAERGVSVVAVEIDRDLAGALHLHAPAGVKVVTADFLETDLPGLVAAEQRPPGTVIRVAGNIPYNISSPILFKLIEFSRREPALRDATLLMQREVVDRIVASPGSGDYGVLAVSTAVHAASKRVLTVPAGAFRPIPKVTSAVVRLTFRPSPVPVSNPALFERMVRTIFQQRRKTLRNALKPLLEHLGLPLSTLGEIPLDLTRRPETLQLTELSALADSLGSPQS